MITSVKSRIDYVVRTSSIGDTEKQQFRFANKEFAQEFVEHLKSHKDQFRIIGKVSIRKSLPLFKKDITGAFSVFIDPFAVYDQMLIRREFLNVPREKKEYFGEFQF